jgi:regulatory protein
MPRITAIETQARRPQRRSVFVDGEFLAGVDLEAVAALKLRVGQDVAAADLRRLLEREEEVRARELCLRWLGVASRTRRQLADRLRRKDVSDDVAARVLDRLQASGLIDDAALARDLVRVQVRTGAMGRRRLALELAKRGVSREDADAVLAGEAPTDEAQACRELAERKAGAYRRLERPVARRRLAGFLARRGFDAEDVRAAVDAALPEKEQD